MDVLECKEKFLKENGLDNYIYCVYCDIGTHKKWVREATSPEKFFLNYNKLLDCLHDLAAYENEYEFKEPYPSEEARAYKRQFGELTDAFIYRAWEACLNLAATRKSEEKRKEIVDDFFNKIKAYEEILPARSGELLEQIRKAPIDYGKIEKREAPPPTFDFEAENALKETLSNSQGYSQTHFALLRLIDFYYKFRTLDQKYLGYCKELCKADISLLPLVDMEEQQETGRPFVARIPSFDRLYMIEYNNKDYLAAIEICNQQLRCEQVLKSSELLAKVEKRVLTCRRKLGIST